MWVIVCDDRAHGGADPPLALYTYMPGRGAMWARQLLGAYQGILQVDAWQAYDQFGKDDRANAGVWKSYCWAHLRRKFVDAGSVLRSRRMRCSASPGSTASKRTSVVARPRSALLYGRSEAVR